MTAPSGTTPCVANRQDGALRVEAMGDPTAAGNLHGAVDDIINELRERGVEFVSLTEAIDTTTPIRPHAHDETSDYKDMIYAASKPEIEAKRKAFIRKWRLKSAISTAFFA